MRMIITGAGSGIGEAVAERLVAGALIPGPHRLLLVDRDEQAVQRVATALGSHARALHVDVTDPACGETIKQAALEHMDGVDSFVSNAGIIQAKSLDDLTIDEFDRAFAVNTRATWLIGKALLPLMRQAGGGSILATGSMSARHATPALGAYSASKAALAMLVKQLANEWGPFGIRCNCVSPGPTLTAMTKAGYADDARRRAREASIPTRRLNSPEDVANAILFLASESGRQINGIDLMVDGGLSTTLMTAIGTGSGQG